MTAQSKDGSISSEATGFIDNNEKQGTIDKTVSAKHVSCIKWLRTFLLMLTWICQGVYMEAGGPTLKDMILKLNSNYEDVANAISARGIGVFAGCLISGFAVDKFPSHNNFIIGICLTIAAVAATCVPWVPNVLTLWLAYLILGATQGALNLAGQRQVLLIWGDNSASPLNAVHIGYALGAFAAPLISNPFLAVVENQQTPSNFSNVTSFYFDGNTTGNVSEILLLSESRIEYSYLVIGLFTFAISITFYIQQFCTMCKFDNSRTPKKSLKGRQLREMVNPAKCADGNFCFGVTILTLLFLRYAWLVGWDRTFGTFLRSYAIDQLDFSKDDASYLNTSFWACYAGGRLAGIIVARFVPVKVLLLLNSIVCASIAMLILIFAREFDTALWALSTSMGFSLGPLFPTGIAWGDDVMEMTGLAIAILLFGASVGEFVTIKVDGITYSQYGPTSFVYTLFFIGVLLVITDLMLVVASLARSRLFSYCESAEKNRDKEEE